MKKARKVRWNVLAAIDYVCQHTKGKQLKYDNTVKMQNTLNRLKAYFGGINENQVIILCAVLDITLSHIKNIRISEYLGMSTLAYLQHNDEIEDLDERCLLNVQINDTGHNYSIEEKMLESVLRNTEINIEEEKYDSISFTREIKKTLDTYTTNHTEKIYKVAKFEEKCKKLPFVKDSISRICGDFDRFCFYTLCYYYSQDWEANLQEIFREIYGEFAIQNMELIITEKHFLLEKEFIKIEKKGSVTDTTLSITDKSKHLFLGEYEYLYERQIDEKSLIQPDSIVSKPLFYSKANQEQIDMLYSSLQHENLSSIQNGLRAKGFPTGICVLLYGAPGTGKTESVYQIAKATHRQIVHVDISQTKSCWFGESEKMIDKIFENYKRICKRLRDSGKNDIPILLFNEADAILQKRTEFRGGGTEKTENAMQNILLEKMENFDGILIATTNLAVNMDVAFERRFLYKIKFDNPTVEAKTSIWRSKLNWLPESQARQLANEYNFSGGEIENVVRKATMEEIIKGSRVSITRLEEICNTEKLNNCESEKKIGFCM